MNQSTLPALPVLTEEIADFIRSGANLPADWTDARIAALQEFIPARFRTPAHLVMFLSLSQRYELDPFAGEIWGWEGTKSFKDPETGRWVKEPTFEVMIGRDGRTKFASKDPNVLGVIADVVLEGDEFEYRVESIDGVEKISVTHVSKSLGGRPKGCYAVLKKREGPDQGVRRAISDYKHLLEKPNWKKNLPTMLLTRVKAEVISLGVGMPGVITEAERDLVGDDDAGAEQMADATLAELEAFKASLDNAEEAEVVEVETVPGKEGDEPQVADTSLADPALAEEFKRGLEEGAPSFEDREAEVAEASVSIEKTEPGLCACGKEKHQNAPACNACLDEALDEPDLGL